MSERSLYSRRPTYLPDGQPMVSDLYEHTMQWARVSDPDKPEQWVVGQDWIGQHWLSTVWIGEINGTFETGLFQGTQENNELVDIVLRYESWLDALRGHLYLLTLLQLARALPRWPTPQNLYDVAQQVTDGILGPGTWRDPRRLHS